MSGCAGIEKHVDIEDWDVQPDLTAQGDMKQVEPILRVAHATRARGDYVTAAALYRRAHELAREAAKGGVRAARWLAAAACDRWLMYQGKPQKYGTQFVPDGVRYRLWDTDPLTTDAERRTWDVPPWEAQLRRAEEMTRREQQPDMDEAPRWLRDAIERWNGEEGGGV